MRKSGLIHFESNRHDNKVSTKVTYYIDYEIAYKYSASDIATFSGDVKNKGEHAKATLETLDYKEVAKVEPTADGWGRVASNQIQIDFKKDPILYTKIDSLYGGFHLQAIINNKTITIQEDTTNINKTNYKLNVEEVNSEEILPTYLRLGVNQETGVGNKDVWVHYEEVKVVYINGYTESE